MSGEAAMSRHVQHGLHPKASTAPDVQADAGEKWFRIKDAPDESRNRVSLKLKTRAVWRWR